MIPGFMYAARMGDFVKIGYASNVHVRVENLRSAFCCAVEVLGAKEATMVDEARFHMAHQALAVGTEIYPLSAAPIQRFIASLDKYDAKLASPRSRPHIWKWKTHVGPGVIPTPKEYPNQKRSARSRTSGDTA